MTVMLTPDEADLAQLVAGCMIVVGLFAILVGLLLAAERRDKEKP